MAQQYSSGFSVTEDHMIAESVHTAINDIVQRMTEAQAVPNWTTLQVVQKDLPTGWTQMPTVKAFGVLLSTV